jgi:hypothetical protein
MFMCVMIRLFSIKNHKNSLLLIPDRGETKDILFFGSEYSRGFIFCTINVRKVGRYQRGNQKPQKDR